MAKILLLSILIGLALAAPRKIDPQLTKSLRSKNLVNIFVKFGNGNADTIENLKAHQFSTRLEKSTHLIAELKKACSNSQANAMKLLQLPRFAYSAVKVDQFWISNELYIKAASIDLIRHLEALPEVSEIREELVITLDEVTFENETSSQNFWNLEKIETYEAWEVDGYTNRGENVVVASIDTGVRPTHVAIQNKFRGLDYGWFDPYGRTFYPHDTTGLGTFMMGIAVGEEIGVAPDAKWIACKGCNYDLCEEADLRRCGQWILEPTYYNGSNPDPSQAPHIVFNSWGTSIYSNFYNDVIDIWYNAEILPIFSVGHNGPMCGSISSPADHVYAIGSGSTTSADSLRQSSSRGPSFFGETKPDISAPGEFIRSSWGTSNYAYHTLSGSAFSSAHVAGVAALALARNPTMHPEEIKYNVLLFTADTNLEYLGWACGRDSDYFPNNFYGYGRLNARRAVEEAIARRIP